MGQTGGLGRGVGLSGADHQFERDPGLDRDPGKKDFQPVFQRVFASVAGIVGDILVAIAVRIDRGFRFHPARRQCRGDQTQRRQKKVFPVHLDQTFQCKHETSYFTDPGSGLKVQPFRCIFSRRPIRRARSM